MNEKLKRFLTMTVEKSPRLAGQTFLRLSA